MNFPYLRGQAPLAGIPTNNGLGLAGARPAMMGQPIGAYMQQQLAKQMMQPGMNPIALQAALQAQQQRMLASGGAIPAGMAGLPAGVHPGMPAGVHPGLQAGVHPGMPAGVHPGMPAGVHPGIPTGIPCVPQSPGMPQGIHQGPTAAQIAQAQLASTLSRQANSAALTGAAIPAPGGLQIPGLPAAGMPNPAGMPNAAMVNPMLMNQLQQQQQLQLLRQHQSMVHQQQQQILLRQQETKISHEPHIQAAAVLNRPATIATEESTAASTTPVTPANRKILEAQQVHWNTVAANAGVDVNAMSTGYMADQISNKPLETKEDANYFNAADINKYPLTEYATMLDSFNCDLNLKIDSDCYAAESITEPAGFCFCWSGVRANYGLTRGKICYEVFIVDELTASFGETHVETSPCVIRVGWSTDTTSFLLGEEPNSYGYDGTAKFSTNNEFRKYGEKFSKGDVITAMIDLDTRPASISFAKNGVWLGVAVECSHSAALYPHISTKNCRFEVNFGQRLPAYPPPVGYHFPDQLMSAERVRGSIAPAKKTDCEMLMLVGLPGSGKTSWALNRSKQMPNKHYNIIGTDTLIERMKVDGLARKLNYNGSWDTLINMASAALNKLFTLASRKKRNYILDQTNTYSESRARKMKSFLGYKRICVVIQPIDDVLKNRAWQRTRDNGKFVPEEAVCEMKRNYTLPKDNDPYIDTILWPELQRDIAQRLIDIYNKEGCLAKNTGILPVGIKRNALGLNINELVQPQIYQTQIMNAMAVEAMKKSREEEQLQQNMQFVNPMLQVAQPDIQKMQAARIYELAMAERQQQHILQMMAQQQQQQQQLQQQVQQQVQQKQQHEMLVKQQQQQAAILQAAQIQQQQLQQHSPAHLHQAAQLQQQMMIAKRQAQYLDAQNQAQVLKAQQMAASRMAALDCEDKPRKSRWNTISPNMYHSSRVDSPPFTNGIGLKNSKTTTYAPSSLAATTTDDSPPKVLEKPSRETTPTIQVAQIEGGETVAPEVLAEYMKQGRVAAELCATGTVSVEEQTSPSN